MIDQHDSVNIWRELGARRYDKSDLPTWYARCLPMLDEELRHMSDDVRARLATYILRYVSPISTKRLFRSGNLSKILLRGPQKNVAVLVTDVRDFVHAVRAAELAHGKLEIMEKLLERFYARVAQLIFEHEGIVGEFAGDRVLGAFGLLDDAVPAYTRALDCGVQILRQNEQLINLWNHELQDVPPFQVGIGVAYGSDLWIGDIGSVWRREMFLLGTTVHLAARCEDLLHEDAVEAMPGFDLIATENIREYVGNRATWHALPNTNIRGIGCMNVYKLKTLQPGLDKEPIRAEDLRVTMAVAEHINSTVARHEIASHQRKLREINETIIAARSVNDLLPRLLSAIQTTLAARQVSVYFYEPASNDLILQYVAPDEPELKKALVNSRIKLGSRIIGIVAQNKKSEVITDALYDARFKYDFDMQTGFTSRSMLCAPLLSTNGELLGALQVLDSESHRWDEKHLDSLTSIASAASIAIENAQSIADLQVVNVNLQQRQRQLEASSRMNATSSTLLAVHNELRGSLDAIHAIAHEISSGDVVHRSELLVSAQKLVDEVTRIEQRLAQTTTKLQQRERGRTDLRTALDAARNRLANQPLRLTEGYSLSMNVRDMTVVGDQEHLTDIFGKLLAQAICALHEHAAAPSTDCPCESEICVESTLEDEVQPQMARIVISCSGDARKEAAAHRAALFAVNGVADHRRGGDVAYRYLEELGGTLTTENYNGCGTILLVRLPIAEGYEVDDRVTR
ncbi:MAG: GAF domain-containing protein [Caldilineaceae bacterium]